MKIYNYFKNTSPEFRSKNIDERRYYLIEEMMQNELMSRKHKKVYATLNYIEHFLILFSKITGCIQISAFATLLGIPIGITSSSIGLKICAITAGIKKYNSIIKKKKKKHDKIVLLAKSNSDSIEVFISKVSIHSNISHDKFVFISNVLRKHDEMKEEIKNVKTQTFRQRF